MVDDPNTKIVPSRTEVASPRSESTHLPTRITEKSEKEHPDLEHSAKRSAVSLRRSQHCLPKAETFSTVGVGEPIP